MTAHRTAHAEARNFFESYRDALLSRDVDRIAGSYHCPALIAFPGNAIQVTSQDQTRQFFRQAIGQYAGVDTAIPSITVIGSTDDSIWADVTWNYDGAAAEERMVYQLLATAEGWRIGVLTPC